MSTGRSRKGNPPMQVVRGNASAAEVGPEHAAHQSRPRVRTIAVVSGKSGVGKSNLAANLAVALGQRGARVLLVDADFTNAQLDLVLGVHPRHDLSHVVTGARPVDEVLVNGPQGVTLVPGPGAGKPVQALDDFRREVLFRALGTVGENADLMIVDTPAGPDATTLEFCRLASDVVVVTSTEVMSLPDAYAMLKALQQGNALQRSPRLVVNMATTPDEGQEIANRMRVFARHFMRLEIDTLGSIPEDHAMIRAERAQEPLVVSQPDSPAAVAIRALAAQLWKPLASGPEFDAKSESSHRLEA